MIANVIKYKISENGISRALSSAKKKVKAANEIPEHFTIELVLVTPDLAKEWLSKLSDLQRNLKPGYLREVKGWFRRGKFEFTGDPIRFDEDGNLIDGQHRLTALVEENATAWFVVMHNFHSKVYGFLDQGSTRRFKDLIDGNSTLAGAVQYQYNFEAQNRITGWGSGVQGRATNDELLSTLKNNPGIIDSAQYVSGSLWGKGLKGIRYPMPTAAFLHYRFSAIHAAMADSFFEGLAFGASLEADNPILVLRNRIFNQNVHGPRGGLHRAYTQAITIKAWNFFRSGKSIKMIKFLDTEEYPQPI